MNQIKEQWFKVLIDNPQVVGTKGKLGRNNVIFTLSLAYYASKLNKNAALMIWMYSIVL